MTRLFWVHPMVMDYRRPLFDLADSSYEITFFLQQQNRNITHPYKCAYGRRQVPNKQVRMSDVGILKNGIRNCDIFLTSFLLSRFSMIGILIAALYRKPVIVWEEMNGDLPPKNRFLRFATASALTRFVDAFFVLGEIQKRTLTKLFGIESARIFVANEYPGHLFHAVPQAAPANARLDSGMEVLLYMGRLVEFKGIRYLIEAVKLLSLAGRNIALLIAGAGILEAELKRLCDELKTPRVHFLGHIHNLEHKSYLYHQASMLVVPSIVDSRGEREGGPLVVLEALSAGLPVIVTNQTGSSQAFIRAGINGYVAREKDAADLAAQIARLLDDRASGRISARTVLNAFSEIPDHRHQFSQLQNAINYCIRRRTKKQRLPVSAEMENRPTTFGHTGH